MLELLKSLDESALLFLNSLHTSWLDPLIFEITDARYWLPLYLVIIGFIIYHYRWRALYLLLFLALVVLLTDQLSASLIKPWVGRLRPTHNPNLADLVHTVNGYKGGLYSFVSSHAANAFGVATFLWLAVSSKVRWIWVMFIWAVIFSYTRIYLGVHYPGDIIFGGLLGAAIGWVVWMLMRRLPTIKNSLD
jgi:undecaprenyl-diphosphatase